MATKPTITDDSEKSPVVKLITGAVVTAVLISLAFNLGGALIDHAGGENRTARAVGIILGPLGAAIFAWRFKKKRKNYRDERLIAHQGLASRWATFAGALVMSGWLVVDYIARFVVRWDLIIIMSTMAASKLIALFVYDKKN